MSASPEILTPQRRTPGENVAAIHESLSEIAEVERERVKSAYEHGKQKVQAVEARLEDYVRQKPVRSLLVAAGAGALLGFVLGRRR